MTAVWLGLKVSLAIEAAPPVGPAQDERLTAVGAIFCGFAWLQGGPS